MSKITKIIRKLRIRRRKMLAIGLVILTLLTPLAFLITRSPASAGASWFNDSWAYRKKITFGNTGAADSNKKVKFDIDTATPISEGKMQTSCQDTRFTDANGKLLRHYLDDTGGDESRSTSGPIKIDDAGDPGALPGASRQVVQTSGGTPYAVINDGGSCEVWMSIDGSSWSEQDGTSNPACTSGSFTSIAVAIDSSDSLHIAYIDNGLTGDTMYITFNTSTNTFGTEETIYNGADSSQVDLAVDSANKPHAVFSDDGGDILYSNRVGGSWKAYVTVYSVTDAGEPVSLAIDEDDLPEVATVETEAGIVDLIGAVGNLNDATSFTTHVVDTSVNVVAGERGASIGIDQAGNTWIAYVREDTTTDDITLAKRTDGNETTSWTTGWTIDITNNNVGYEPSIAVITSDIYVFYEEDASDNIVYDRYDSGDTSWLGETNLASDDTDTYQDVHARWSFLNNNDGYFIDYLYSDGTDVYWNYLDARPVNIDDASDFGMMSGGRRVVRTSDGTLYAQFIDTSDCEIWKSTDGTTWAEQDSGDSPTCSALSAIKVDSNDDIHLAYRSGSTAVIWVKFTTSTAQFGTPETVGSGSDGVDGLSLALDSNDAPHIVWNTNNATATDGDVHYRNRTSGTWQTERIVENVSGSSVYLTYNDITINEDNIPEIVYVNTPDGDLTAAVGDQNNATSFTLYDVDTNVYKALTVIDGLGIAIDASGNTWVAYRDEDGASDYINIVKHNDGDAWTVWQSPVETTDVGYEPAIAIDSHDIYVFYQEDSTDQKIVYNLYDSDAATPSWLGETVLYTPPSGTDYRDVRPKWSFEWNNFGSNRIDFLFSHDDTEDDVYWSFLHLRRMPNKVDDASDFGALPGAGRQVVRASGGDLYTAINDAGNCEVWKSVDEGNTWAIQDSVDDPACNTTENIAMAIDGNDDLHIIYEDEATAIIRYITFDTPTDQFGSEGTVTGMDTPGDMAIAIDSSNIPHVAARTQITNDAVEYSNRVGASWDATPTSIEETASGDFQAIDIAIDEDDLPEVSYINSSDNDLTAAEGDANDATAFTDITDVDTDVNDVSGTRSTSIAIDSSGNTWIAYVDENGTDDYVTLVKHNDADAWTTWQTPVTNSNVGYEPSIVIDGATIYVFYEDDQDDIVYDKYTTSWAGEVVLEMGPALQGTKAKWSYLVNNGSNGIDYGGVSSGIPEIDYLYSDGTDVWYNRVFFDEVKACNTSSTDLWVLIETIVAGDNAIYFYYGNPNAQDTGKSSQFTEAAFLPPSDPTVGSEELGPGPTAYLKFDEGYGTTANDQTVHDNDGALSGGAAWQSEDMCVVGKCLFYDGTNDVVTVTNTDSIDMDRHLASGLTFQGWVRVNSDGEGSAGEIIEKGVLTYLRITNEGADGYADLEASLDLATADATKSIVDGITLNKWHHVAMTYTDDSDDEISVYIDGQLVGTSDVGDGAPATDAYDLLIGGSSNNNFHGFIDEFKVYHSERTADEIKTDFIAGTTSLHGAQAAYGIRDYSFLSEGLVGYWKMDEDSWTDDCSTDTVFDSSGNSYDAKACPNAAGPNGGDVGKFGNAGDFDDAGTTDDYLEIGDIAAFDFDTSTSEITLAAWINADTISGGQDNIISKYNTSGNNRGWRLSHNNGQLELILSEDGTYSDTTAVHLQADSAFTANAWHHIAATVDVGTDTFKLYVDGAEVASTHQNSKTTITDIYNNTAKVHIAAIGDLSQPGNFFDGTIDEARFYNRVFSPSEISALYNWAPGPAGYWNLDENTGTGSDVVKDRSGNGNPGDFEGSLSESSWAPGRFGSALRFKGESGGDGRVGITVNSSAIDFEGTGRPITVEAWANCSSVSAQKYIVSRYDYANFQYQLNYNQATSETTFQYGNQSITTSGYTCNEWKYITGVYDGSNIKLYVDGVEKNSSAVTPTVASMTAQVHIGSIIQSLGVFDGLIDDVRIYNYARTQEQIVEDMNASHPTPGSPIGSSRGHWKFDENYGDTGNDSSPNNNDVNLAEGTTCPQSGDSACPSWTGGKFGNALDFDTAGATDDYVAVPSTASFGGKSAGTISLWYNPDSTPSNNAGIYYESTTADGYSRFAIFHLSSGDLTGYMRDTNTGSAFSVTESSPFTFGNWYHIVLTVDADTDELILYLNGNEVARNISSKGSFTTGDPGNISIGKFGSVSLNYFIDGQVDEVKIYDFALTPAQVKVDYNQGSGQVMGAISTDSSGNASWSASREFCLPGDGDPNCAYPVGEWKQNEGTGTGSNAVKDTSGNDNHGTMESSMAEGDWVPGKIGATLDLDGTNDYIEVADTADLSFSSSSDEFTLSAWIYPRTLSADKSIMTKYDSANNLVEYAFTTSGDELKIYIDENGDPSGVHTQTTSAANLQTNTWYHVTAVVSMIDNDVYFWVNGIRYLDTTSGVFPTDLPNLSEPFRIGSMTCGGGSLCNFWDGYIDEARVFDFALWGEIGWLYNRGKPVGHWKLDDCSGTTAYDSSPNGNNGTINIGASGTNDVAGTCSSGDSSEAWNNGTTGKFNYSLHLDETDDNIDMGDQGELDFGWNDFTLMAWVKTNGDDETQSFIDKRQSSGRGYAFAVGSDGTVVAYADDGSDSAAATTTATVDDGNWHHLTATFDRDGLLTTYVDGVARATDDLTLVGDVSNTGKLIIGDGNVNIPASSHREFKGQIDDVRLYNYKLTDELIKRGMNEGAAVRFGPSQGAP